MRERDECPVHIAGREVERFGVETLCRGVCAKSIAAIAGPHKRQARVGLQRGLDRSCGTRERDRGPIVMSDELGMVFGTAEALDPPRCAHVLLPTVRARDLTV